MKLLHEILQEEIARAYPMPPAINEGGRITLNLDPLMLLAKEKKEKAYKRITDDKALAILIGFGQNLLNAIMTMPVPPQIRNEANAQVLVELIAVWEETNNKFNDQFKTKP